MYFIFIIIMISALSVLIGSFVIVGFLLMALVAIPIAIVSEIKENKELKSTHKPSQAQFSNRR